jgi:hypothetical protein
MPSRPFTRTLGAPRAAIILAWRSVGLHGAKINLALIGGIYLLFGFSLIFQEYRWASTPAYRNLLEIAPSWAWGGLFLAAGAGLLAGIWLFSRRGFMYPVLVYSGALTMSWFLAFVYRYASSETTTPETWASWFAFGYLHVRVMLEVDGPRRAAADEAISYPDLAKYRESAQEAIDKAVDDLAACGKSLLAAGDIYMAATVAERDKYVSGVEIDAVIAEAHRVAGLAQEAYAKALRLRKR